MFTAYINKEKIRTSKNTPIIMEKLSYPTEKTGLLERISDERNKDAEKKMCRTTLK